MTMDITSFIITRRDAALLIGDYKSYHGQLSRQLASVKKKLGLAIKKNAKFSKQKEITAEDVGKDVGYVHLQLLTVERAFAHAMAMKASVGEDAPIPGSTRWQIVSRLNKAAKTASYLCDLLSSSKSLTGATDTDILEAKAYASSLAGAEQFEKHAHTSRSSNKEFQREMWSSCLEEYSVARVIYASLLKSTKKEVFKDLLSTTVDPAVRFAAYQSHIPRTLAVVDVSRKLFPRGETTLVKAIEAIDPAAFEDEASVEGEKAGTANNIPTTITWRGRKARIPDASIGQALAASNTAAEGLTRKLEDSDGNARDKAAAYDDVLIAAQDVVDAVRRAIEEHEKEGVSESDSRMQDLRVTFLAVEYEMISWRVGRNRVLIGEDDGVSIGGAVVRKRKKGTGNDGEETEKKEGNGRILARLRERVVLYDAILQSIDSVLEVPGAVRDESFVKEMNGKRDYFRALKCLNISHSYSLLSSHRNALALLLRATNFSSSALESLSATSSKSPTTKSTTPPRLDITPSTLQSLHTTLTHQTLHLRALVELHKHNDNASALTAKNAASAAPVVERLGEYVTFDKKEDAHLVDWPPRLRPVPVKPLFLDVAWNYIEYPGRAGTKESKSLLQSKGDAKAGAEVGGEKKGEEKKKGWFGFGR
ncbi:hypothetical protein EJ08DRAFT_26691 [Tothia fuscella]|uniref:Signal recognition particle subunit SRP68 n=1 Tax=Tothia fuscella TaxID=1048955 RepID=A0A9P4NG90_9PEZI|nr:hypothetical protein EJ08DRAFT_26691 [Tothia fuscella]